ncbi:MAG: hypothetical protein ACTFAK_15350 [Candidatus Electronema sp. VV]
MLSHETHSAAEAEQALSSKASEKAPSASQLWSVIEFSRQFPDLTMCLVADLNNAGLADEQKKTQFEAALEDLRFPVLAAPDPRELLRLQKKPQEPQPAAAPAEEIVLFAAGKLPPDTPPTGRQEKKTLWRHLLSLFSVNALLV